MKSADLKYAPGYDLFKLIVAVILTIILIFLLLRNRQQHFTVLVLTATPAGTSYVTSTPDPTATFLPTMVTTQTSNPTTFPIETATPTQVVDIVSPTPNNCPSAVSRIKVGDVVNVLQRLNLRTGPGLTWPIILTNNPNTKLEVIGGPICTLHATLVGDTKAHLWWQVRMDNGRVGWSAEGQLLAASYFLEPAQ